MQIAKSAARDRVLDDRELVAVYRAAQDLGYPFGTIVQLLILTGQRRSEIAAFQRAWVDFDQQTITLPGAITKNGRQHTFPFSNTTRRVLEVCPASGDLLFPARGASSKPFSGWSRSKEKLDKKLENVTPRTLHDLRRTFSTGHAALGTPPHITERLLNHVDGTISGVAAIYNRFRYIDEMRDAATAWEKHLRRLVTRLKVAA